MHILSSFILGYEWFSIKSSKMEHLLFLSNEFYLNHYFIIQFFFSFHKQ